MRSGHHRFACLTMLVIGAWLSDAAVVHATPEQPSVLILLSGQPGSPGATAIASGIRDVLQKDWSFRISIDVEHVDVADVASPEEEERRLRTIFGSNHAKQRFDMIVAALPDAFRFVLRTRDELWPGTPVVGGDDENLAQLYQLRGPHRPLQAARLCLSDHAGQSEADGERRAPPAG